MTEPVVRAKVMDALRELCGPYGVTASALSDYMGFTMGSVRSALKYARHDGHARVVGRKFSARWWPADYDGPVLCVVGSQNTDNTVLSALRKIGRYAPVREIFPTAGMSLSPVQSALSRLVAAGEVIHHGKRGSHSACYGLPGWEKPVLPVSRRDMPKREKRARAAPRPKKPKLHVALGVEEFLATKGVTKCPPAVPYGASFLGAVPVVNHAGDSFVMPMREMMRAERRLHEAKVAAGGANA